MFLKVKEAVLIFLFLCCYGLLEDFVQISMTALLSKWPSYKLEVHLRGFIDDFILGIQANK